MSEQSAPADPERLSASSWSARNAALLGRNVPADDPRVVECQAALAYHRVRRAVAAEVEAGMISAEFGSAVTELVAEGVAK